MSSVLLHSDDKAKGLSSNELQSLENYTNSEGLRRRGGNMVPRISGESFQNSSAGRRRTFSSSSDTSETKVSKDMSNGVLKDNPIVEFEDPLKSQIRSQICETSFTENYNRDSSSDLLSPTADVSLSSDENEDNSARFGSFNSKNLYKPLPHVDANFEEDDITEEAVLLPDGEFRRIREGNREIDIKISTEEKSISIALQVFFPFMIAGMGTVAAGLLLDVVQHWAVFKEVSEVFILVPALLGLKGNLEMTLASRMSTAANLGSMDTKNEQASLIIGNLVLTQAQALVVAALASIAAVVFGWVLDGHFDVHHAWLLCASSLVTASLASLILGSIMVVVIILSKKCGINPDNVATPIAASLGDLTTLALLSTISSFFYDRIGTHYWIAPVICVLCVILLPLWVYISHHNKYTHDTLYSGWTPVISAMCISSAGGLVLSYIVERYHGIAVFNPVVNGVGGNLVAVQASRISTSLHRVSVLGKLPQGVRYGCIHSFCTAGGHSKTARILIAMSVPGHMIFLSIIAWMKAGHTSLTPIFTSTYLLVGILQVTILLFVANWMVHWMWKRKNDPDNYSIPYLTAIGDLLGTLLLAVAFHALWLIGDRDADVGD
ncbi:solute carrier family 41 member 1-like [Rhopilema esculentum]|uniref:solute carrier family 41 member 1-like n=1 Tax=Rhopilema esculentum TaxID=499914 RepID=UPI0031D51D25|eukprot:gene2045-17611_t